MKKNYASYLLIFALACISTMCVSCARIAIFSPAPEKKVKHGPPPHAPAHGYRHKQADSVELVFDSKLNIYTVVDYPDHYYIDGFYYRLRGDQWQVSVRIDGGWKSAAEQSLPPGLRKKVKTKGPHGPKGKGHLK